MKRVFGPAGVLLLAGFLAVLASAARPRPGEAASVPDAGTYTLAGRVTDTDGLPVGALPVRILVSFSPVSLDVRLDRDRLIVVGRGKTALDGTYRVTFRLNAAPRRYYLSFYDPADFDDVQFTPPERMDVTARLKAGGSSIADARLAFSGNWPKVQELLRSYPKGSPKAGVIRRYGIAEEIRKGTDADTEVWWYYSKGRSFTFRGDEVIKKTRFTPILK